MHDKMRHNRPYKLATNVNGHRADSSDHIQLSLPERRRFSRSAICSNLRLLVNDESYAAKLIDISPSGAQVRTTVVPRMGVNIIIEVERLGAIPARVVRRLSNSIAIEFELPENMREDFIRRVEELHTVAA